jgi:hypothetical protein
MNTITLLWTVLSFVFLVLSVMVVFPARREYADAKLEVEALGGRLNGTRVIAESELALRRCLVLAQGVGAFVMACFLATGLLALLLPPPASPPGQMRAQILPLFMLAAEVGDGTLQGLLLLATLEQRRARRKWRELAIREDRN